jgi:hypothetical protein
VPRTWRRYSKRPAQSWPRAQDRSSERLTVPRGWGGLTRRRGKGSPQATAQARGAAGVSPAISAEQVLNLLFLARPDGKVGSTFPGRREGLFFIGRAAENRFPLFLRALCSLSGAPRKTGSHFSCAPFVLYRARRGKPVPTFPARPCGAYRAGGEGLPTSDRERQVLRRASQPSVVDACY